MNWSLKKGKLKIANFLSLFRPSHDFKNLEIFLEDSEDDNEPILVLDEKNKPYIESLEAKLCELMQIHDSEISKVS